MSDGIAIRKVWSVASAFGGGPAVWQPTTTSAVAARSAIRRGASIPPSISAAPEANHAYPIVSPINDIKVPGAISRECYRVVELGGAGRSVIAREAGLRGSGQGCDFAGEIYLANPVVGAIGDVEDSMRIHSEPGRDEEFCLDGGATVA